MQHYDRGQGLEVISEAEESKFQTEMENNELEGYDMQNLQSPTSNGIFISAQRSSATNEKARYIMDEDKNEENLHTFLRFDSEKVQSQRISPAGQDLIDEKGDNDSESDMSLKNKLDTRLNTHISESQVLVTEYKEGTSFMKNINRNEINQSVSLN